MSHLAVLGILGSGLDVVLDIVLTGLQIEHGPWRGIVVLEDPELSLGLWESIQNEVVTVMIGQPIDQEIGFLLIIRLLELVLLEEHVHVH